MDEHFHSLFASSGDNALRIMEDNEIAVLVTDMKMPGMDGLTLLKIVKKKYPKTILMVLSGFAQLSQILATVNNADIFKFILKPWKLEEGFLESIYEAINYYNLRIKKEELEESLAKQNKIYQKLYKNNEAFLSQIKKDINQSKTMIDNVFSLLNQISIEDNPWILGLMRGFLSEYVAICPLVETEIPIIQFIKNVRDNAELNETEKVNTNKIALNQKASGQFSLASYAFSAISKTALIDHLFPIAGSIAFEEISNGTDNSFLMLIRRIYNDERSNKKDPTTEQAYRIISSLCENYRIKVTYEHPRENLFAFTIIMPVTRT